MKSCLVGKSRAGAVLAALAITAGACGREADMPTSPADSEFRAAVGAQVYQFDIVIDSERDAFDAFGFGCPAMNEAGEIAFPGVLSTTFQSGIFRSAGGAITTIALDNGQFGSLSVSPSINNLGDVAFAAFLSGGASGIFRGRGGPLTRIIKTENSQFAFFGFDVSVNDAGVVAFKGELDNFDEGLFTGSGAAVTTVYLASTSQFQGNDVGPAINNAGQIAFEEDLDTGQSGIFLSSGGQITTVALNREPIGGFFRPPGLNNNGVAGFMAFLRRGGNEAVFRGNGGPLTRVADSRGLYSTFDFGGPSINDGGAMAFASTLDTGEQGIFAGPDPVADRVILAGDSLDGAVTTNFVFCREGLNNQGQLAFLAFLDDGRSLIVRATP